MRCLLPCLWVLSLGRLLSWLALVYLGMFCLGGPIPLVSHFPTRVSVSCIHKTNGPLPTLETVWTVFTHSLFSALLTPSQSLFYSKGTKTHLHYGLKHVLHFCEEFFHYLLHVYVVWFSLFPFYCFDCHCCVGLLWFKGTLNRCRVCLDFWLELLNLRAFNNSAPFPLILHLIFNLSCFIYISSSSTILTSLRCGSMCESLNSPVSIEWRNLRWTVALLYSSSVSSFVAVHKRFSWA